MAENREQYLADVFGLVEPDDVRWVFISHDDVDHTGNVNALMDACPNATLIINWFMVERMGAVAGGAAARGGAGSATASRFDVGDRRLHAVRPPIFDSPTTRGLFDPTTGVYWASDSLRHADARRRSATSARLDHEFWVDGMTMFDQYVSPWLALVDERKFHATVDRVEQLRPTAMAGCHTPAIGASHVARAFDITRRTPGATVPPQPDQAVLEQIQQTLTVEAA